MHACRTRRLIRYVADKAGCSVTAVELQGDLNAIATVLTQRCGLENQVTHWEGNILEVDVDEVRVPWGFALRARLL